MRSIAALQAQTAAWSLALDSDEIDRLIRFAEFLSGYREANVIGARDISSVVLDHILDSLSCFLGGALDEANTLVDVGSGGGLPGLPIAIVRPDLNVTLVEATGKKARFLGRAVEALGLSNVLISNARVEEVSRQEAHRNAYDVATARALARLSVVAEYCVPLVRVGGRVISMKGRLDDEELAEGRRALKELGAEVENVIRVPLLPEVGEKERRLVVLRKTRGTPGRYPRSVGVPAKKPLGVV